MLKFVKFGVLLLLILLAFVGTYLFLMNQQSQVFFEKKVNVIALDGRTTKEVGWGLVKEIELGQQVGFLINGLVVGTDKTNDGIFIRIKIPNKVFSLFLGNERDRVPLNAGLITSDTGSISLNYYKDDIQWKSIDIDQSMSIISKNKDLPISLSFNLYKSESDQQDYYSNLLSECKNNSCTTRIKYFQSQIKENFELTTNGIKNGGVISVPITRIILE